ncbi:tRNA endonuclease [Arthroderma uncinatum]|uniref:tRNA endonuclease n=1 Tax=Arthroderma uncinatum TaxID=74035 RepID=UPI00144A7427|nr:tRNA endonuclease [Arthroderma uncinatum]KAF3481098.1 tRNA endonuclease [Arthroderma uncinatum]
MKSFIQFAVVPTSDTPGTTLILHYDDKRYFFGNLSEGSQRACIDNGVRMSKLSEIFMTGTTSWSCNGGMLGMLLTVSDTMTAASAAAVDAEKLKIKNLEQRLKIAVRQSEIDDLVARIKRRKDGLSNVPEFCGQRPLSLYGGPNLTHTLATARTFVCRTGVPIEIREFGGVDSEEGTASSDLSKPAWSDENIQVWPLPIYPSAPKPRTRKRSLDEFEEAVEVAPTKTAREKDMQARQKIVLDMFNSQWRLDTLIETPLAEVSLPATLFVRDADTGEVKPYDGPKPGDEQPLPDIKVLVRQPWPGAMVDSLPAAKPSECAISYIVRGRDIRGKFDRKRAEALNIQKSDYKILAFGGNVQSIDGKTITPDMVLGDTRPGKGFAVIELPSVDYIQALVDRKEWQTPEFIKGLEVFIWILGRGVGGHPLLQEFVAKMSKYQHVVSAPDYCPDSYGFPAASSATIDFSTIDSDRYQIPFCNNRSEKTLDSFTPADSKAPVSIAQANLVVDLEPVLKFDKSSVQNPVGTSKSNSRLSRKNSYARLIRESSENPRIKGKAKELMDSIPNGDAEVISLGTGSSCPSKYRNVSGTLLRVPGHGNYLLDAGEGTLGQLKRIFGPEELKEVFRELKAIWISHLHADHHLGTTSVIRAWYEAVHGKSPPPTADLDIPEDEVSKILQEKRLYVISAPHMLQWMAEYANVENYGYDKVIPLSASSYEHPDGNTEFFYTIYRRQKNGSTIVDKDGKHLGTRLMFEDAASPLTKLLKEGTGLEALLTTPVAHCQGAKAVSFVFPTGFKVSYSGDCRPSTRFIEIGRGSTLLIHEATFDDNMISDAVAKRHSTISEAMTVGLRMEAKVVVLTHFSQRYRKMSDIDNAREVDIKPPRVWGNRPSPGDKKPRQAPSVVRDIPTAEDPEEDYTLSEKTAQIEKVAEQTNSRITRRNSSPRSKSPRARSPSSNRPPIVLAFDNMRLRVGDAVYAEAYQPILSKYLELTQED